MSAKPIYVDMLGKSYDFSSSLWQYDYGRILRIQDNELPTAVEIHFSLTEKGGEALTRIGTTRDGMTDVVIPDSMLENNDTEDDYWIYVFIYLADTTACCTVKRIDLRVQARPKPEPFDRPEDAEIFRETIVAVNEAADRAEAAEDAAAGHAQAAEQSAAAAAESAAGAAGYAGDAAGYAGMAKASADAAAQSLTDATMQADSARAAATEAAGSEAAAESFADTAGQIMADTEAKGQQIVADATAQADRAAAQATAAKGSADAAAKTLADTKTEGQKIVSDAAAQATNAKKDAQAAAQSAAAADTDQQQVAADKTTVEQLAKQVQELTAQVQTLTAKAEEYAEAAKRNEQADLAVNDPDDPAYVKNRTHWTDPGIITNTLEWDGDITGKYAVELPIGNNPTAHYYIANISDQVLTMEQLDGATMTYIDGNGEPTEVTLVAGENLKDMAAENEGARGCYVSPAALVNMYFMQELYNSEGFILPAGISTSVVTSDKGTPPQAYLSSLTGDKLQFGTPDEIHMIDPKYYERLAWVEKSTDLIPMDLTNDPSKALAEVDLGLGGLPMLHMTESAFTDEEAASCYIDLTTPDGLSETFNCADFVADFSFPGALLLSEFGLVVRDKDALAAAGVQVPYNGIYLCQIEGYTIRLYSDQVKIEVGRVIHPIDPKFLPTDYINSLIDAKLGVIENGYY